MKNKGNYAEPMLTVNVLSDLEIDPDNQLSNFDWGVEELD